MSGEKPVWEIWTNWYHNREKKYDPEGLQRITFSAANLACRQIQIWALIIRGAGESGHSAGLPPERGQQPWRLTHTDQKMLFANVCRDILFELGIIIIFCTTRWFEKRSACLLLVNVSNHVTIVADFYFWRETWKVRLRVRKNERESVSTRLCFDRQRRWNWNRATSCRRRQRRSLAEQQPQKRRGTFFVFTKAEREEISSGSVSRITRRCEGNWGRQKKMSKKEKGK